MRYREDREQSAEILRLAVAAMGKQPAAANPAHYALWYEHCAGLNPGRAECSKRGSRRLPF